MGCCFGINQKQIHINSFKSKKNKYKHISAYKKGYNKYIESDSIEQKKTNSCSNQNLIMRNQFMNSIMNFNKFNLDYDGGVQLLLIDSKKNQKKIKNSNRFDNLSQKSLINIFNYFDLEELNILKGVCRIFNNLSHSPFILRKFIEDDQKQFLLGSLDAKKAFEKKMLSIVSSSEQITPSTSLTIMPNNYQNCLYNNKKNDNYEISNNTSLNNLRSCFDYEIAHIDNKDINIDNEKIYTSNNSNDNDNDDDNYFSQNQKINFDDCWNQINIINRNNLINNNENNNNSNQDEISHQIIPVKSLYLDAFTSKPIDLGTNKVIYSDSSSGINNQSKGINPNINANINNININTQHKDTSSSIKSPSDFSHNEKTPSFSEVTNSIKESLNENIANDENEPNEAIKDINDNNKQ